MLLCSDPSAARDPVAATEVKALLLDLAGLVPATAPTGVEPAAGAVPTAAAGGTPTGSAAGGPSSAPTGPPGTGERR